MQIIVAALLALGLLAAPAAAEDKKPTGTPPAGQAQKMKACNKEAADKQLKGDERKQFMSACLKGSASGSGDKKS